MRIDEDCEIKAKLYDAAIKIVEGHLSKHKEAAMHEEGRFCYPEEFAERVCAEILCDLRAIDENKTGS